MIKKIALGLIFTLIAGVLVVGAVNRTTAKSAQYSPSEAVAQTGNGGGQNLDGERQYANQHEPLYLEKEQGGQGQGQNGQIGQTGQGQGQGQNGRSTANPTQNTETPLGGQGSQSYNGQGNGAQKQDADRYGSPAAPTSHDDLLTYQGLVSTAPAPGVELVIITNEGDLTIGTGPSQWLETVITLQSGDEISVTGFWENGEFKAVTLTRASDALTITLRDETGRPMWSGSANNQGQGQGQGQGNGRMKAEG
jgi:hypothetical protein